MSDTFQAVIAYRMNKTEERLNLIEDVLRQLNKDMAEVLQDLKGWKTTTCIGHVERMETPEPIDPVFIGSGNVRKPEVVRRKWAEWKRLTLKGKTPSQIARMFKCNHTSVCNAISRNFEPAWLKKGKR